MKSRKALVATAVAVVLVILLPDCLTADILLTPSYAVALHATLRDIEWQTSPFEHKISFSGIIYQLCYSR